MARVQRLLLAMSTRMFQNDVTDFSAHSFAI
jgi:hypothetical protein